MYPEHGHPDLVPRLCSALSVWGAAQGPRSEGTGAGERPSLLAPGVCADSDSLDCPLAGGQSGRQSPLVPGGGRTGPCAEPLRTSRDASSRDVPCGCRPAPRRACGLGGLRSPAGLGHRPKGLVVQAFVVGLGSFGQGGLGTFGTLLSEQRPACGPADLLRDRDWLRRGFVCA